MAVILAGALFRLVYSGMFPLVPDETNYWQWSRYLAPGYHDQAPMIAWTIKLGTLLLGHTEMGVRLPSVLASIYMVMMAGRWFGGRAALNTAIISQGIFAFIIGGLLATADGLQAMAWAGACYHVARAYEKHRWFDWLVRLADRRSLVWLWHAQQIHHGSLPAVRLYLRPALFPTQATAC